MRMHGHAEHDPADYVPPELFEEWAKKDPVELFAAKLQELGFATRRGGRGDARARPAGSDRGPQEGAGRPDARCPTDEEARVYAGLRPPPSPT